jgi:mono/diheme cytochrome c family protein
VLSSSARVLAVMVALPWLGAVAGAGQSRPEKLYSQAQAKQGLATYDRKCATCHDGGTMGPELWGEAFLSQWAEKDIAALYKRMKETMPEDNPGSLTEAETLGVVAFVLQQNEFSSGDRAIESATQLNGVKFASGR